MDKAAMYESMMESMQTDALFNLYSGIVTPVDRQILADMPLPSDMVDPFASQDVEPLSVMNLTYVSLSGWIAEAKKEKYYSERFISLSKLVMKGVTTMGRGLVTLHQRGEDLSAAPMQIDDLISVGSYHFRKSYLGVVQFSARHPEIGERLLVNQLGWSTTLLRLYKTKEKLAKPVLKNEEGRMKNEEMPNGNSDNSSFLLQNSSFVKDSSLDNSSALDDCPALNAVSALFEPAAFSAQRALTSQVPTKKSETTGNKKSETRNKENEEVRSKNEESATEIQKAENPLNEEKKEEEGSTDEKNNNSSFFIHNSSLEENSSLEDDSSSSELPPYLEILKNVMERSDASEDGVLTFTFDEMCFLAEDPGFREVYPQSAEKFRNMLAQYAAESGEDSS